MTETGYTKFAIDWTEAPPHEHPVLLNLIELRKRARELGVIGTLGNRVSFGNVSVRDPDDETRFLVSGTQTGHIEDFRPHHCTLVTSHSIPENRLSCTGPVAASSESLTHAAVYAAAPSVNCILHFHDKAMWNRLRHRLPSSPEGAAAGTTLLAQEIAVLAQNLAPPWTIVMGGHEDGLLTAGRTVKETLEAFLHLFQHGAP